MPPLWKLTERLPRALTISLGLAAAEPELAGMIRGKQIAAVVRLTPVSMMASCLNALILLLTLRQAGLLTWPARLWAASMLVAVFHYARGWVRARRRQAGTPRSASPRSASPRALRRAVLHGTAFGMLWGAVPVLTFVHAPPHIQLVIGCLTAGMLCAGPFVLTTVPLAGIGYVAFVLAGATYAIFATATTLIDLGLAALLWIYAAVVITNLCSNAILFTENLLSEARLQAEIRARELAQAQVAHAQRMTALGELAGGIAHDFNNILQSITGNASLVARRAEDTEQVHRLAGSVLDAAERGGAISRRLLAFARQDTLSAEPVDVSDILLSATDLLEHTLAPSTHLSVQARPDLPFVLADKAQLEIILVNLAANARDAMPEGGSLRISAFAEHVATGGGAPPLSPGDYVRIEVCDSGHGMDAATLARATEPFFTTKRRGKGTGLGLAMAKGFAEQSGGALTIESAPGQGTVVLLWLPQTEAPALILPTGPVAALLSGRTGRLMVVDDDTEVRETLLRCLEDGGFLAIGKADAAEALEFFDLGGQVDMLITDVAMPGMNGIDLVREAKARLPSLRAVLLTGYVGDAHMPDRGDLIMLQKPIRPRQLSDRIRAILAAPATV